MGSDKTSSDEVDNNEILFDDSVLKNLLVLSVKYCYKMSVLGFEYTSNLVDLLLSPLGSSLLYQNLVPREFHEKSCQEKLDELENHLVSHGLNQDSVRILEEAGIRSCQLLALLIPRDLERMFPTMMLQQRRLLQISIQRLDPRPPYQVTAGLKRFLIPPMNSTSKRPTEEKQLEKKDDTFKERNNEIEAAIKLVEDSRKILECPVCYLTCLPPRIWQCNNGHLTCSSCHTHTRVCPLCRTPFSNVRPLAAERLAAQVPTPCKNQPHGCGVSLAWADRQLHEAVCDLAVGHCPVLSCSAQVRLNKVVEHLTGVHSWSEDFIHHKLDSVSSSFSSSISTTTYLHSLQDQQNWWWGPQCVSFDDNLFFLLISRRVETTNSDIGRGYFNFWVWVAGNESVAGRYKYKITVHGASGEEVSYMASPVCLEVGLDTVREDQTSLLLSDGAVRRLIRNGERLHYMVQFNKN